MSKYIIKDWAYNNMFPGKEFDTFEDGWEFLTEALRERLKKENPGLDDSSDEFGELLDVEGGEYLVMECEK